MAQKSCVLGLPLQSELHLVPNGLMFLLENGEIVVETTEPVGIREVGCVKFWNLVSSESVF